MSFQVFITKRTPSQQLQRIERRGYRFAMADPSQPPPTTRVTDWNAMCRKVDADMDKPEVVYKFSNGKEKLSTDRTESGVYRR